MPFQDFRQFLDVLRQPRLLLAVVVATLPLVVVGLLWKDEVDRLFDSTLAAGIGLCGTAVLMALMVTWRRIMTLLIWVTKQ